MMLSPSFTWLVRVNLLESASHGVFYESFDAVVS